MNSATFLAGGPTLGLGLAALGRPGYMNLGHAEDLPADRTVAELRNHCFEILDAAYAAGIRYVDAARSYGEAETFLGAWLDDRRPGDVAVGSKWGYAYTAGWKVDVPVHEVKEHSLERFETQARETGDRLPRLDVYWVHSVTEDSPLFDAPELQRSMARWAGATGTTLGVTVTGPKQTAALARARAVEVDSKPLFGAVQATWNVLEPSVGDGLAEAHAAGWVVVIKEALANGRLSPRNDDLAQEAPSLVQASMRKGVTPDVLAMAAALSHPWCDCVLSGAATTGQLASHLRAVPLAGGFDWRSVAVVAEPKEYWERRSRLPWT